MKLNNGIGHLADRIRDLEAENVRLRDELNAERKRAFNSMRHGIGVEQRCERAEVEWSRLESALHAAEHGKSRLADALTVFAKMDATDAPDGVSMPDWLYAVTSARAALKTYAPVEGGGGDV